MRIKILFIMNNLECGGAEKSLISLLESMDKEKYKIDLLLFNKKGVFLKNVPEAVNIINYRQYMKYFDMPMLQAVIQNLKSKHIFRAINRILFSISFKSTNNNAEIEQKSWKYISRSIPKLTKKYDIAIGYLEKNPIYFCIDKVDAKNKIGFIHSDYNKIGMKSKYDLKYFAQLNHIVGVSDESVKTLKSVFPMYQEKISIVYNILDPNMIKKMAEQSILLKKSKITIVTVGRLTKAKGHELAIETCKLLINNNFDVTWYVIGAGEERERLNKLIAKYNLQQRFILLGLQENPYPYIKACDIYVQTSLYEGRCLALSEAKILCKPIVTTDFDASYDQIKSGENGIIVPKDPKKIYYALKQIIENPKLKQKMIKNLSKENYDKYRNLDDFYKLIED